MNFLFENSHRVAIHLDNCKDWLALDTALMQLKKVIVPVPHFFTPKQIAHMVHLAGIDAVVCEFAAIDLWQSLGFIQSGQESSGVIMTRVVATYPHLPKDTHKITFTSGTTSEPKGVCLTFEHLQAVGKSLAQVTHKFGVKKHLSVLPLSVLLENVAANYAVNFADVEAIAPSLAELGLSGSSQLDVTKLVTAIRRYKPDSLILMPQMLKAIISYCQQITCDLSFLKFIAVGGAVCSKGLLSKAKALGLPVFEGYGISECGSVISLNTDQSSLGSVGKVLPHQQVKINKDGEIMTKGYLYAGYLGQKNKLQEWYATGDLGRFDTDNNLYIIGRKSNVIINSFGRNISPDWIEAEMLSISDILQVVIYGEAQPFLIAICFSQSDKQHIIDKVNVINKTLPDYAQVKQVIMTAKPFTVENKQLTASGKTKHKNIFKHFEKQIQEIYANSEEKQPQPV